MKAIRLSCKRYLPLLLLLLSAFSITTIAQDSPLRRNYAEGEQHHYQMTTVYYQNGQWKSTTIAICEIRVNKDSSGLPVETINWLSQKSFNGSDTIDETGMARNVHPYNVSLHPRGSLVLPSISESGMTGAITDLHTFYVAVSRGAGIDSLYKPGDVWNAPAVVKGDFSNGKTILKGEDCIQVSNSLVSVDAQQAVVHTRFLPPLVPCLQYYDSSMNKPVAADTLNNIQMIMAAGGDKLNIQFGREWFEITSWLSTKTGMIERAKMTNELKLRLRVNCNDDLSGCQTELPWIIYREVTLQRIF